MAWVPPSHDRFEGESASSALPFLLLFGQSTFHYNER